jgi:hypothetical protein
VSDVISKSELQRLITAMKNRKPKPVLRPNLAAYRQTAAIRRKIGKRIEPLFVKAGLDVDKINKIFAEGQTELRQIRKRQTTNIKKTFAGLEKSIRQSIDNRRKALLQLVNPIQPPALPTFVVLDTPFLIWPSPAGILVDRACE